MNLCIPESAFAKTLSLGGGIRTCASGNQIRCTHFAPLRQRSTWDPCRGEVFTIGALSHFNGCRARQRKNVRLRSQSVHFYTDINPEAGESARTELPQREASPHALRTHCEFSQAHRRPTRGDFARDTQHSSLPQRRMRNCEYSIASRAQQRSCREGRSTLSQSFQLHRAP